MTQSVYPGNLDVFLALLDGFHPVAADDLNLLTDAIERIEVTLGYGITDGVVYGPKGGNASVRERLDTFLEDYGGLRDVAFVTGTLLMGQFNENGPGAFIGFGKSLSSQNYTVLFTAMNSTQEESGGTQFWTLKTPAIVWIAANGRIPTGVTLQARRADGSTIPASDETTVTFGLLVFGPLATY